MPGVDANRFGLPGGTAIRYERPADALVPLFSSYAVLDSDPVLWRGSSSWLLPSWAKIWIVLTPEPITVEIGSRRYDPLSSAGLYGVTSRAMPVTSQGGVSIIIDVSPAGWARFFGPSAEALRDRITPLHSLLPVEQVRDLVTALGASDRDLAVKAIIDESFTRHLPPPHPAEPLVTELMAIFGQDDPGDLTTIARRLGVGASSLVRMAKQYFGFTPKMLLMRTRFLRALTEMLVSPGPLDHGQVPPGYHDVPHFIRDANLFLGMSAKRFVAADMPYLRAALRARKQVIGSATPALDGGESPSGAAHVTEVKHALPTI